MHPVLFEIGGIPVNTFGIMVALGVMIASMVFRKRVAVYGISPETAWDLSFWLVIFGTLGARFTYILLNLSYFTKNYHEIFTLRFEGLTSYGALITGIPVLLHWSKRHNISLISLLDAISVPFLIGHTLGRLGCLFNGCCYGRHTENGVWGIVFPKVDPIPHYPTQLYDSFLTFIAILTILFIERNRGFKPTQSFYLSLFFYNLIRIFEEIWRQGPGGTSTTIVMKFSLAQMVAGFLVLLSSYMLLRIQICKNNEIL